VFSLKRIFLRGTEAGVGDALRYLSIGPRFGTGSRGVWLGVWGGLSAIKLLTAGIPELRMSSWSLDLGVLVGLDLISANIIAVDDF
jgi:hypothetical protein